MTESNLFACPKPVAFQGCHLNTEFHKAMGDIGILWHPTAAVIELRVQLFHNTI